MPVKPVLPTALTPTREGAISWEELSSRVKEMVGRVEEAEDILQVAQSSCPCQDCQPGDGGELWLRGDGGPEPGRAQGTVSYLPQQIRIGQEQLVGLFCNFVFCEK